MSRQAFLRILSIVIVILGLLGLTGVVSAQGRSDQAFEHVRQVQERNTERLMNLQDVEGTAIGFDQNGQHQVTVFTARQGVGGIPRNLEGVPVEVVVTGKFYALANPSVLPVQSRRTPTDRTPPAAPTDLTAGAISSSQIDLDWADNSESDLSYYNVYRSTTSGGAYSRIASNVKVSKYSNTGLTAETTYYYAVTAVDKTGNESAKSGKAFAETFAPEPCLFPRPAPIGVSTGNRGECSAGTIGCRVKGGGNVYALSNNHVYALENKASIGSEVLQPGLYDTGCVYNSANVIGKLYKFIPIVFSRRASNKIDAAVALTNIGMVDNATPDDGYGIPSSTTATPSVNMPVQKYGRTTSLTKGTITGTNVIINVGYSSGTARFVNQIIVESDTAFIGAGDSGSLLVTDDGGKNPVGLLFAGTSDGKLAVANPIDAVLSAFGVTIDGSN
jgi:hypothetical protein